MKKTALIMAGGRGERFWPRSRKHMPKQFLSLTDDGKTMIQLTVERIRPLVELEDIYIATNKDYKPLVLEQLPGIPEENILCEPIGRNTAPCIGLGAIHIAKKYEDALMMVLPSDHLIKYNTMFVNTLSEGCAVAEKGANLVTYEVERFVEKPSLEVAKEYLATEEYLWNSGMFVWKISTILDNLKKYMGSTYEGLMKIKDAIGTPEEDIVLENIFPTFQSESIDYGIMEKASNIYILPGVFGWDDVGSWLAVGRIKKSNENGNVVNGNIITINSKNNIIEGSQKLIATVGIEDLIIVDTEDATLICNKNSAGDIKKVLENLKICNRDEYI